VHEVWVERRGLEWDLVWELGIGRTHRGGGSVWGQREGIGGTVTGGETRTRACCSSCSCGVRVRVSVRSLV
jgi:hypothetical protein